MKSATYTIHVLWGLNLKSKEVSGILGNHLNIAGTSFESPVHCERLCYLAGTKY